MKIAGLCALPLLWLAGPAAAGEPGGRPRLCPEDAPPGVRLPSRPGCASADGPAQARAGDGFVDLGNGTRVRIGGRVGAGIDMGR